MSWLQIGLVRDGEDTTLELVHETPLDPAFWEQFGPGAVGVGWELVLMTLGLHLESGAAVDPVEGAAFPLTREGVEFVRLVAAGWAAAAVQDGDEAAAAQEAADRTLAAYTTVPEAEPES